MKKGLIIVCVLSFYGCIFDNNSREAIKLAENKFSGYDQIIKDRDDIPEIRPESKKAITISVPSDLIESGIIIGEIIDSVYYVKLETNSNSLIGTIDKLLYCDDRFIVVELIKRQSILLFSKEGKFIKSVGKAGTGPNEYLSIIDVTIDYQKKNIVALDDRGHKLMYYDMDGNFIRDQKLIYFANSFSILSDGSFLVEQIRGLNRHLPSVSEYNIFFAQSDLSITGKALSFGYRDEFPKITLSSSHSLNVSNLGVLFNPLYSDTIYEIKNSNSIVAKYLIDLGRKKITKAFNKNTSMQESLEISNTRKFYFFDGSACETDDYLYFYISGQGDCYYSKPENKLYYGSFWRGTDDNILSYSRPTITIDNFFVGILLPQNLVPSLKYLKINSRHASIVENLKAEDNPVLFFYSLK